MYSLVTRAKAYYLFLALLISSYPLSAESEHIHNSLFLLPSFLYCRDHASKKNIQLLLTYPVVLREKVDFFTKNSYYIVNTKFIY